MKLNFDRGEPFFRTPTAYQQMRLSDAERQAVADRLADHYSQGRLDQDEFDERVARAMSAKTRADLDGLFDDLPEPGPAGAPRVSPGVSRPTTDAPIRRRRGQGHKVLALVLIGFIALAAAHAVFWMVVPFLWLAFAVVIVLAATGHFGRRRTGHSH